MIRAAVVVALSALAAGAAVAEPVEVGPARLDLAPAWTGDPLVADAPLVRRHPGGATLTVTRAAYASLDAWRRRKRDAYLATVEAAFLGPGTTRLAGRRTRLGQAEVPTLELTFTRAVGGRREVVAVRVLFFWSTTIAAAAAAPDTRAGRALVEAAVARLVPVDP